MYDSLIFDLDGTLWDACPTTADAWNQAISDLGESKTITSKDINAVAGLPQRTCIETIYPELSKTHKNLTELLTEYEEKAISTQGGKLYDNVLTLIPQLAKTHKLFIVSNCLTWYLDLFFENTNLKQYFTAYDCVGTSGLLKSEMITRIIKNNNLKSPVYIGDTKLDQDASHEAGIPFIHATYGFNKDLSSQMSISSFMDLSKLVNNVENQ